MKWGVALCVLPTYVFFIRRQFPKLTRKLEFLLLAEILSIPTLIVLVLTRGGYESLRWVPRLLSLIFNCQLKYSGTIIQDKNVIYVVNHQSGMDVWSGLEKIFDQLTTLCINDIISELTNPYRSHISTSSHSMVQPWRNKVYDGNLVHFHLSSNGLD